MFVNNLFCIIDELWFREGNFEDWNRVNGIKELVLDF